MTDKVDWLYKAPTQDREEYLLGRKIDKFVDPTLEEQASCNPVLSSSTVPSVVDLSTKVRQDPLFLIKQKEEAAKKVLASNPVKMKQLKQMSEMKRRIRKHEAHSSHKEYSSHKLHSHHRTHSPQKTPSPHRTYSHHRSRSPHRTYSHHRSRSPHRTHPHKTHKTRSPHRTPSPHRTHPYHRAQKEFSKRHTPPRSKSHTKRLTREEMEIRRQEMLESARSHEQHRKATLKKHKEEAHTEDGSLGPKFLQSLRVQSLSSSSSLSDRIHRNIQSVQRTKCKLDSNFLNDK